MNTTENISFESDDMVGLLTELPLQAIDDLPFGVLGLNTENLVQVYNRYEERCSGLSRERVVGRHCFFDVAPCMNNYMVAERLDNETPLDAIIPYVLTFRMRPTPVRLRMLSVSRFPLRWILISRV